MVAIRIELWSAVNGRRAARAELMARDRPISPAGQLMCRANEFALREARREGYIAGLHTNPGQPGNLSSCRFSDRNEQVRIALCARERDRELPPSEWRRG